MDLDLTDEQRMLRDVVRSVCATHAPLDVVREMEDHPVGYPEPLWKQLAELDVIGLLLPEAHGGSGMSLLEGVVVYSELGRALAPAPHFTSAVICGGLLAAAGSEEQRTAWLPRVARGDAILTLAWLEPDNGFGPAGVQARARLDGDSYVIAGVKRHVPFASSAERLVVPVRVDGGRGAEGVELLLVDPSASGITIAQQHTLASDTQHKVTLAGVRVPVSDRIGAAGTGWSSLDAVLRDGAILLAAQAAGGARQALELTTQYAKDRVQFDKPLGAFQAIAHYLADAKTAVEGAELLVWEAAWARAEGRPEAARLAPMAKLFACRTFRDVTAMGQQVFGGVGFTVESDIQLYFRRAKQLQLSWWDTRHLESLVAAEVLD